MMVVIMSEIPTNIDLIKVQIFRVLFADLMTYLQQSNEDATIANCAYMYTCNSQYSIADKQIKLILF